MDEVVSLTSDVALPHLNHPHPQRQQAEPEYLTLSPVDNGSNLVCVNPSPQMHPSPVDWFPASSLVHFQAGQVDPVGYDVREFDVCHQGEWQ